MKRIFIGTDNAQHPVSCERDGFLFASYADKEFENVDGYLGDTVIYCTICGAEWIRREFISGEFIIGTPCSHN